MPRLVLVDSSLLGREMIRTLLAGIDWVYLVGECAHYEQAGRTIENGSNCDAVIMGLDGDPLRAVRLVGELRQKRPSLPIIVTSSQAGLLVQAHRQGASALLDCPVLLDSLLISLRGVGTNGTAHDTQVARTIGVIASRGGVGCTTLAVNLGCTLAAEPRNEVALVDLDLVTGSAEIALDLVPEVRLSDVPLEQLDLTLLDRLLIKDTGGLMLLPRPGGPQQAALIHAEHVQRILGMLRVTSSHVVVDLGRSWSATELEAMHAAETLLLVAIPELCSTRNTVVLLNALAEEGLADKVRIVMNRMGAYFGSDSLTLPKIEEVIGRPVYWQIPNDYKVLTGAWNAGIPLIRYAPKSKAHQTIAALAKDLCAKQK